MGNLKSATEIKEIYNLITSVYFKLFQAFCLQSTILKRQETYLPSIDDFPSRLQYTAKRQNPTLGIKSPGRAL